MAWARIEPLLPPQNGQRGGRWRDHRQVINAILWKLRTGAPWRDLPERYGPWKTAHERLRLWTADGTWERIMAEVVTKDDSVGEVEFVISIDSSHVRAHHTPPVPGKRGCSEEVEALAVDGEALGRSRGGLTSKLHLAVDAAGHPVAVILTPGQAGDNPQLLPLLDSVAAMVKDTFGRVVPVARVLADKAYSHDSTRRALRGRRIKTTIPERVDQQRRRKAKGSRGGRPPAFDPDWYRVRNVVERCFNRLKQFRGLATRYAKRATTTAPKSSSPASSSTSDEDPQDRS